MKQGGKEAVSAFLLLSHRRRRHSSVPSVLLPDLRQRRCHAAAGVFSVDKLYYLSAEQSADDSRHRCRRNTAQQRPKTAGLARRRSNVGLAVFLLRLSTRSLTSGQTDGHLEAAPCFNFSSRRAAGLSESACLAQ